MHVCVFRASSLTQTWIGRDEMMWRTFWIHIVIHFIWEQRFWMSQWQNLIQGHSTRIHARGQNCQEVGTSTENPHEIEREWRRKEVDIRSQSSTSSSEINSDNISLFMAKSTQIMITIPIARLDERLHLKRLTEIVSSTSRHRIQPHSIRRHQSRDCAIAHPIKYWFGIRILNDWFLWSYYERVCDITIQIKIRNSMEFCSNVLNNDLVYDHSVVYSYDTKQEMVREWLCLILTRYQ